MIKKILILLFLMFAFLVLFNNSYCYVLSDIINTKFPEGDLHGWDDNAYKLIVFNRSDNNYYLYSFSGNKYSGNYIWYLSDSNSINLYGFSFTYLLVNKNNELKWSVQSQGTALWGVIELNNIVDFFNTSEVNKNGIEIVYCNCDILYKDTNKIYFYEPPLFNSIIFQRSIGGCMYQIFRTLLIPLLLFIISLIGFYKSIEFIQNILISF